MNTRSGSRFHPYHHSQLPFRLHIDLPRLTPNRRYRMEPGSRENEDLGCIDLTANDTLDGDVIDLTDSTASQSGIGSDPVVVISPTDVDNADTHRRETRHRRETTRRRHRIYLTPTTGLTSDEDSDGIAAVHEQNSAPSGSRRTRSRRSNAARSRRNNSTINVDDLSDEDLPEVPFNVPDSSTSSGGPTTPVKVTCPVCLDTDAQIRRRNGHLFSTTCGHIFCNTCINQAVETQRSCPSCRKRLSKRQIHKIYL